VDRGKPSGAFVWRGGIMGSIYKRGKVYWIQYYRNGKPYLESQISTVSSTIHKLDKKANV